MVCVTLPSNEKVDFFTLLNLLAYENESRSMLCNKNEPKKKINVKSMQILNLY